MGYVKERLCRLRSSRRECGDMRSVDLGGFIGIYLYSFAYDKYAYEILYL
jgi:hypothetical protein